MTTDDLIDRLAGDLAPTRGGAVGRQMALGLGGGVLLSAALMVWLLGIRSDLGPALSTIPFWVKFVYVAIASSVGLGAVTKLARPAGGISWPAFIAGVLVAVVVLIALEEYAQAPDASRYAMIFGNTSLVCPIFIVLLALPIYAGIVWAMRGLAPTRTRLAGLAAGLGAGSFSALVYSFHCDETSFVFLALWYSLGILATGLIGLVTSRLLRW